jgi:hypothetical protein
VLVLDGRREDQAPVVGFYSWLRSTEAVCASCSDSKLNHTPSKQGRVFSCTIVPPGQWRNDLSTATSFDFRNSCEDLSSDRVETYQLGVRNLILVLH